MTCQGSTTLLPQGLARHPGCGQDYAKNGIPLTLLQNLIGHASITTTRDFYLRVSDASEREATGRQGRLLAGPSCRSDSGDETHAETTPAERAGSSQDED